MNRRGSSVGRAHRDGGIAGRDRVLLARRANFDAVRARWRPSDAQLLDRHGEPIHELRVDAHGRRLAWTPLAAISPAVQRAVIASEDHRFFSHQGVDFTAIAAAAAGRLAGRRSARREHAHDATCRRCSIRESARAGARRRTVMQKLRQMLAALRAGAAMVEAADPRSLSQPGDLPRRDRRARRRRSRDVRQGAGWNRRGGSGRAGRADQAPNAHAAALSAGRSLRIAMNQRRRRAPGAREMSRRKYQRAIAHALSAALTGRRGPRARLHPRHLAPRVAEQCCATAVSPRNRTLDRDLQAFTLERSAATWPSSRPQRRRRRSVVVENSTGDVWAYVGGTGALSSAPYVDGVLAMRQPARR